MTILYNTTEGLSRLQYFRIRDEKPFYLIIFAADRTFSQPLQKTFLLIWPPEAAPSGARPIPCSAAKQKEIQNPSRTSPLEKLWIS